MSRSINVCRTKYDLAALVFAAVLLVGVSSASAVDTSTSSAAEIRARWQQLRPVYSGSPYLVAPTLTPPFTSGVARRRVPSGWSELDQLRALSRRLPMTLSWTPTYTDRAQHGAVLLAVGEFAHSQPRPSTMDTGFYTIANGATSSSNIGWGYKAVELQLSCMGLTMTSTTSIVSATGDGFCIRR